MAVAFEKRMAVHNGAEKTQGAESKVIDRFAQKSDQHIGGEHVASERENILIRHIHTAIY